MGYTRRQLVEDAFDEIGLSPDSFDIPADLLQSGKRKLDRLMAEWDGKGIRLGYPIPASPETSDLDDETGVPDTAWSAIVTNLALRIAPSRGKSVSPDTKAAAAAGYRALLLRASTPPQKQLGPMVSGAGNKPWRAGRGPFLPEPAEPLQVGRDGDLEFN